jgi:hypothetical protein
MTWPTDGTLIHLEELIVPLEKAILQICNVRSDAGSADIAWEGPAVIPAVAGVSRPPAASLSIMGMHGTGRDPQSVSKL